MPTLVFDESEILEKGSSTVNSGGLAYVSRKLKGKKIRWLLLKNPE